MLYSIVEHRWRIVWCGAFILALAALLIACQNRNETRPSNAPATTTEESKPSAPASQSPVAEQWIGKWNGPEGTFLEVAKSGGKYQVVIRDLDGARTFPAEPIANGLQFTRDNKVETIHAGNGEDAGMKWLLDKKNCLVVKKGEGFCRD